MARNDYLECGRVQNTHGCHGWVRVESYCDTPEVLASLPRVFRLKDGQYLALAVKKTGRKQQTVLMQLEGIDDMDAAEQLKNETLYAAREDIPLAPGAYFLVDLPGLPVIDADCAKQYGSVKEVSVTGGREWLIVTTPAGERMVPLVSAFIDRVDVASGVYVRPIPGLLEDEK